METRANYLLVGSFVLLIVAGTVVFILWLAKFQFDQQFTRYDIDFPGSVSGLKTGAGVARDGELEDHARGLAGDHAAVVGLVHVGEVVWG